MNLYIKMHTSCVSFLADNKTYFVLPLSKDLFVNGKNFKEAFVNTSVVTPGKIIIEKPFLKLLGDSKSTLADTIIHIQRNFGVLSYILHETFPEAIVEHVSGKIAREKVYGQKEITKDVKLSEVRVLLEDVSNYSPLELLTLHDTLILKSYIENGNSNSKR